MDRMSVPNHIKRGVGLRGVKEDHGEIMGDVTFACRGWDDSVACRGWDEGHIVLP